MNQLEIWQSLIGSVIGVLVAYLLFTKQRIIDQRRLKNTMRAKFQPSIDIANTVEKSIADISEKVKTLTTETYDFYHSNKPTPHIFHVHFDEIFEQIGSEITTTQHRLNFLNESNHQECNVHFYEAKYALQHLLSELSSIFASTKRMYVSSGGLNSTIISKHHTVCQNLRRLTLPIFNNRTQFAKMKKSLENAIETSSQ
ncbi:hypothetical protein [Thalassospira sp. ER-Se-21-Dark]|uniref:hypothetical protein n=1 Tax=Thalassospira sp. ER-Se-21-Dark TaxID=2585190 RepID=UPI001B30F914|nr:hypothetical protein [Thalassospira sp. ER-Se-21-Dark]MBP3127624.1 hypothetical protein [Thalassospira sp. ER-Se-21-Dark]